MSEPGATVFPRDLSNYPFSIGQWAAQQTPIRTQTFTNPAAASGNAIKTAIATVASPVTYSDAALNGAIGTGLLSPPRNVTITTAGVTPANAPATALITGLDILGAVQTETINVGQTATTVAGVKAFAYVKEISLPAADGTAATLAFGTGNVMGLDSKMVDLGVAAAAILKEVENGAVVTTGTFVLPSASAPFGTYSPATPPNGTLDYSLAYMVGA